MHSRPKRITISLVTRPRSRPVATSGRGCPVRPDRTAGWTSSSVSIRVADRSPEGSAGLGWSAETSRVFLRRMHECRVRTTPGRNSNSAEFEAKHVWDRLPINPPLRRGDTGGFLSAPIAWTSVSNSPPLPPLRKGGTNSQTIAREQFATHSTVLRLLPKPDATDADTVLILALVAVAIWGQFHAIDPGAPGR